MNVNSKGGLFFSRSVFTTEESAGISDFNSCLASIRLPRVRAQCIFQILVQVHSKRSRFLSLFSNETRLTRRRWSKQFGLSIFVIALLCLCARVYISIYPPVIVPYPFIFLSPAHAEFINNWPLKPWPLRKYNLVCPDFHTFRLFRRRFRARARATEASRAVWHLWIFISSSGYTEMFLTCRSWRIAMSGLAAPAKRTTIYGSLLFIINHV